MRSASIPGITAPAGGREEPLASRHGLPASQPGRPGGVAGQSARAPRHALLGFSHHPPTTGQILSPAEREAMLLRICQGFRSPQRGSTGGRLQEDAPGPTVRTAVSDSGRRRRTRRLRASCTGRRGYGSEDHPRIDDGSRTREAPRRAQRFDRWEWGQRLRRRSPPAAHGQLRLFKRQLRGQPPTRLRTRRSSSSARRLETKGSGRPL